MSGSKISFLWNSVCNSSKRSTPTPDPVPPPVEWNTKKPWRFEQRSAVFLLPDLFHDHVHDLELPGHGAALKEIASASLVRAHHEVRVEELTELPREDIVL